MDIVSVCLYEPFNRVYEARYGANAPNNKNGNVKEDMVPQEIPPLEL